MSTYFISHHLSCSHCLLINGSEKDKSPSIIMKIVLSLQTPWKGLQDPERSQDDTWRTITLVLVITQSDRSSYLFGTHFYVLRPQNVLTIPESNVTFQPSPFSPYPFQIL